MLRFRRFMLRDSITDAGAGGGTGDGAGAGDGGKAVELPALPENWQSALPEDQRSGMESYKDIPALVKTLRHAQSMVGADKAVIPGKEAKPEDWNAFYGKIGKPQTQEEYDKAIEFGDGKMNEETVKAYKKFAFDNNLLPGQAKAVVDWLSKTNEDMSDTKKTTESGRVDKEFNELRGKWGEKYDVNIASAKDAFRNLAEKVPGSWDWMQKSGLAGEPMMLQLFATIGEKFGEGKLPGDNNLGSTSQDVQKEINTIMGDEKHAYHDRNHPNHNIEVEEMQRRYSRLYPQS